MHLNEGSTALKIDVFQMLSFFCVLAAFKLRGTPRDFCHNSVNICLTGEIKIPEILEKICEFSFDVWRAPQKISFDIKVSGTY